MGPLGKRIVRTRRYSIQNLLDTYFSTSSIVLLNISEVRLATFSPGSKGEILMTPVNVVNGSDEISYSFLLQDLVEDFMKIEFPVMSEEDIVDLAMDPDDSSSFLVTLQHTDEVL
jgi:hypothetical protein